RDRRRDGRRGPGHRHRRRLRPVGGGPDPGPHPRRHRRGVGRRRSAAGHRPVRRRRPGRGARGPGRLRRPQLPALRTGPPLLRPHHLTTTRADGDLAVGLPDAALSPRRAAVVDRPWTWLRQVHGADVVTVTSPGEHAGTEADAAVTAVPGAVLAVTTA